MPNSIVLKLTTFIKLWYFWKHFWNSLEFSNVHPHTLNIQKIESEYLFARIFIRCRFTCCFLPPDFLDILYLFFFWVPLHMFFLIFQTCLYCWTDLKSWNIDHNCSPCYDFGFLGLYVHMICAYDICGKVTWLKQAIYYFHYYCLHYHCSKTVYFSSKILSWKPPI